MTIEDYIERIDKHTKEIEKLNNERKELERADLPRDAHNRELQQIVDFLDRETKAKEQDETVVEAYNSMSDNIRAIQNIADIPAKDDYERREKERELEARRTEIQNAREKMPDELVQSLHKELTKESSPLEKTATKEVFMDSSNENNEIDELSNEIENLKFSPVPEEKMEVKQSSEVEEKENKIQSVSIEEAKNNLVVINIVNVMINNIMNNEYEKIDAIKISELFIGIENIVDPVLKEEIKEKAIKVKEIFIDNKYKLDNQALNIAITHLQEINKKIENVEKSRNTRIHTNQLKDSIKLREDQYEAEYYAKKNEAFLREVKTKLGDIVYSDEQISKMSFAEMEDLVSFIKSKMTQKEIDEIERNIEKNAKKGNDVPPTENPDGVGADNGSNDGNSDPEDSLQKPNFIDAINKLKDSIDPENMTPEEIQQIINKIEELVKIIYKKDQDVFEQNLANAKTLQEKLQLIEQRENELDSYEEYFKHTNKEIEELLKASKEQMLGYIKASYNSSKVNGEYCWKEYDKVIESRNYIRSILGKDEELNKQFKTLLDNMDEIIKDPKQEEYENWRLGMQQFAENLNLDPEKMLPYVNARAKVTNNNVSVDKDFNLHGLGLNNDLGKKGEKKKRKKVKSVEKADGFFKKHPKIKLLAIGLAVVLGSQLGLSGLMMINSTVWSLLGGQGAICSILHAINVGLSKIVGVGLFKFTEAGTYTFLGKEGALALYQSVGAKLTTAALSLGGIGKLIANKIKNKNEKKMSTLKEKIKNRKIFKRKTTEEELEDENKTNNEEFEEEKNSSEEMKQMRREMQQVATQMEQQKAMLKNAIEALKKSGLSEEEAIKALMESPSKSEESEVLNNPTMGK